MIRLEDDRTSQKRWPVILGLSLFLHASIIGALVFVPEQAMHRFTSAMNFSVVKEEKKEIEKTVKKEEKKQEEEKPLEKKEKKTRPAVKPKEDPKPEPPPPPETKKFQMSEESFSGNGGWGLSADIGEERLGSFSGTGKKNVKTQEAPLPPPPPPPPPPPKKVVIKEKPAVVDEVTIPYPAEARRLEIEGDVKLDVSINEQGIVTQVKILKDPGGGLGEAAAKALKKFKFSPARTDTGKAVPYKIKYVYSFVLD